MIEDATLKAMETANSIGAAMDAFPETWNFFLTGPDGAGEFACSLLPAGVADVDCAARRVYERGYSMGRGATRLEAVKDAVAWLRSRMPTMIVGE